MSSEGNIKELKFSDLGLSDDIMKGLNDTGYESPTPIQAEIIPYVLDNRDVLGQAQTGTGKTAAFALPVLSKIDVSLRDPQVLVLAPTRELAIQVAEAFQKYGNHIKGFHVLPIYGGQSYDTQLRQLKRGVHVVVGTPGRVMDHMRRKTLKLGGLKTLILDEADEMLRMGFIDDVEWILEQTPDKRQIALFSATMPDAIRKITKRYLKNPEHVTIKNKTSTVSTIRQRYWSVSGRHKMDALTRILEAETFDGIIIFVRTRGATVEVAEKLEARGFGAAALNGEIPQKQREQIVSRLKKGHLDILVATDVVARGLDIERISHVINYDIPGDTESYVHRIGRTGRAGRLGDAILFVAPRERRMLYSIERATRQKIEEFQMPSTADINDKRVEGFKQRIQATLQEDGLEMFAKIIEQYEAEHQVPAQEIAAALAKMVQGDKPLLLAESRRSEHKAERRSEGRADRHEPTVARNSEREGSARPQRPRRASTRSLPRLERGMERFRIEVGADHDAEKGNIVGAVANESGIENEFIGHIEIYDHYSTIDLPEGMPDHILKTLQETRVSNRKMQMTREESGDDTPDERKRCSPRPTDGGGHRGGGRSGGSGKPRRSEGSGGDGRNTPRRKFGGARPKRGS
ncbi:MAG: DEAD/DEAH box helicase [Mariprofundaceae bacterium]|nr:DEAD/DEAH box helicase [Mariprofundaceae bacterium]